MENPYIQRLYLMDIKILGQRIRSARERRGLSQEEFASLISKDQGTVSEYENGKRRISAIEIPLLAEVLEVPVLYFFENEITPDDLDSELLFEFRKFSPTSKAKVIEIVRILRKINLE